MSRVGCFAEEAARVGPYRTLDAGPRVIEVARITGTVDKCGELDGRFRLLGRRRDRRERFRRRRLEQADLAVTDLPPISVYLLSGRYFVIDGNRRVAAAKRQKLEYMDAQVTEVIPLSDTRGPGRGRLQAALRAGNGVEERAPGLRERLRHAAGGHRRFRPGRRGRGRRRRRRRAAADEPPSREQVRRWHSGFFRPACALLSDSSLSRRFPGAEPGDLFVTVARFYRDLLGGYPPGASYETLLSGFRFARRLPERRPLRAAPFRLLLAVLGLRRP